MELIKTGHVVGTFALDGTVKVVSCSGEYDHFLELKRVYVSFSSNKMKRIKYADGWFGVESIRLLSAFALLKLENISVLEDAKCFVGGDILVERERASFLNEGEFYSSDISTCFLFYKDCKVARVLSVVEGGSGSLLEVKKLDGSCVYVPFHDEFVGDVDIEKKKIELKHEWILE